MLPNWMKQAVKDEVLSQAEAEEMHLLSQESEVEAVTLPHHLFLAAERLWLWELPTPPSLH
jgi:hypothetical protein